MFSDHILTVCVKLDCMVWLQLECELSLWKDSCLMFEGYSGYLFIWKVWLVFC